MISSFSALDGTERQFTLENIESLPFLAATSAGLKALCTYIAWSGIEDCRKCCGGNGYLMAAGIAPLAADYVWQTTAEGDWVILMLQTAQFLIKTLNKTLGGEAVSGPVDYFAPLVGKKSMENVDLSSVAPQPASSDEDFKNIDYLLRLFKYHTLVTVVNTGQKLEQRLKSLPYDDAWNSCAMELLNSARNHCYNFLLFNFVTAVRETEDKSVKSVLEKVCALFACSNILDDSQWNGFLNSQQLKLVQLAVEELMENIRRDAVALVDAFDFPDRVLNSAIGRYDGNVYEALFESAKRSVLNQRDPFDGYNEYLRPFLDLQLLAKRNAKF